MLLQLKTSQTWVSPYRRCLAEAPWLQKPCLTIGPMQHNKGPVGCSLFLSKEPSVWRNKSNADLTRPPGSKELLLVTVFLRNISPNHLSHFGSYTCHRWLPPKLRRRGLSLQCKKDMICSEQINMYVLISFLKPESTWDFIFKFQMINSSIWDCGLFCHIKALLFIID